MVSSSRYKPCYTGSKALIIGINEYQHASPLGYACNDASAVSNILIERFRFLESDVTGLQNGEATKNAILSAFSKFTDDNINPDERIIVFFAGHGCTKRGKRGEIGFLVPFDGDIEDVSTLISWNELIGNAELINAKHVFFIMDACYGGTAVQRYLQPGSMRFARDMLRRFARQVLTAGKADEVVADAGGPRPGHSVFTGHLLGGLEGAAATSDGLITANGLMSYVYDKVAKDYQSKQTPHHGFLDGDGDMIFDASLLDAINDSSEKEHDIFVEVPPSFQKQNDSMIGLSISDKIKEYLSDSQYRIKLHDTVTHEIRSVLADISIEKFPVQGVQVTHEDFVARLNEYERAISNLAVIVVLLARWGDQSHKGTLEMAFSRLRDNQSASGGYTAYLGLQWYPMSFLSYVGGIAALSVENYSNLATVLLAPVQTDSHQKYEPIIMPTAQGMLDVDRSDLFKTLPGHEKHYVPRSEYMFKAIQPILDDSLFLGRSYELLFDRFEVLLALVYADLTSTSWGPVGRFGWKIASLRHDGSNPYDEMLRQASTLKDEWPPLKSGLFNSSYERFAEVSGQYRESLKQLKWY